MEAMTVDAKIAALAKEAQRLTEARRAAQVSLRLAYQEWKQRNGVEYCTTESPELQAMKEHTRGEYAEVEEARRQERNARRRLETAIRSASRA